MWPLFNVNCMPNPQTVPSSNPHVCFKRNKQQTFPCMFLWNIPQNSYLWPHPPRKFIIEWFDVKQKASSERNYYQNDIELPLLKLLSHMLLSRCLDVRCVLWQGKMDSGNSCFIWNFGCWMPFVLSWEKKKNMKECFQSIGIVERKVCAAMEQPPQFMMHVWKLCLRITVVIRNCKDVCRESCDTHNLRQMLPSVSLPWFHLPAFTPLTCTDHPVVCLTMP